MKLSVQKSKIDGCITIGPSKSMMHRYLIASFLSNQQILNKQDYCADVNETISVLNNIKNGEDIYIKESGATLRFMLPILAALNIKTKIVLGPQLLKRPIKELIDCLNENGSNIIYTNADIIVNGALHSGKFVIDASISSQYISGLLFALPLLNGDSSIMVVGDKVSTSYIDMTLAVLKNFGIDIVILDDGYFIKGGQKYKYSEMPLESDWSSIAFVIAAASLLGKVEVKNITYPSIQGDSLIVDLLSKIGAKVTLNENSIVVEKNSLKPIEFSAKNCIDLAPIMSIVLSQADGVSKIYDVSRLSIKESNRLEGIINMLNKFNIECTFDNNVLTIIGGKLETINYDYSNDHRILMSEIIGAMCCEEESIIDGIENINKSYPMFVQDLKKIGGQVHVI